MNIIVLMIGMIVLPWTVFAGDDVKNWAVVYGQASLKDLESYDVVVLEPSNKLPIDEFRLRNQETFGYFNFGEVEKNRPYFDELMNNKMLLEENPKWPGSYFIDIRDKRWAKMVIETIIPSILAHRYDGLFLDTVDNAAYLEEKDPEQYKGMKQAAIDLIKGIHYQYPEVKLFLNRGYAILPEVAKSIDMVVGESVYTTYDHQTKRYKFVEGDEYQEQVKLLKKAQQINPHLKVFTLDYWDPTDTTEIKKIYSLQRSNGFIPYVSTIDLQKLVKEPK